MSSWKNIRLEVAPGPEFPKGSVSRAFLIRLPLHDNACVDGDALRASPHMATARRYWSNEADEAGLVQMADDTLLIRSGATSVRTLKLDGQAFHPGCQLHLVEPDGATVEFRVASVR